MELRRITAVAVTMVGLAPAAFAGMDEPGHKEFVGALVEAINSHDVDRRLALLHSGSRQCVQDPAAQVRSAALRRRSMNPIPGDYRWGAIEYPATARLMFEDKFDYPVRPTHILELSYHRNPTQSSTLVIQIARDGAEWREVVPCMKPAAQEEIRAARAEHAKQIQRADTLLAQMRPELKAEIAKMVRDGRKVDAIKHYHAAAGEDLSIAKYVVDRLGESVAAQ